MAEARKRLLTYAGLKALEDELENLKVVKRKEVAGKIKEAKGAGEIFPRMLSMMQQKDEQRDIERSYRRIRSNSEKCRGSC